MKKWKKLCISLLAICMLSSFSVIGAMAAEEPYTYKVRLSAGNRGTVEGQSEYTFTDLAPNSIVDFKSVNIQPTDEKYYVKGIRLSGRDNADVYTQWQFKVTGDADYVVSYGISANRVRYTVRYLDEEGVELVPSNTFYGDVGDKPVVAYQYIEDYVPQAYALEKTLLANEAENVFDFIYTPGETVTPGQTTVVTVTEGTTAPAAATPAAAAAAAANEGATTAGEETPETVEVPDEETPDALVDLDEEETPRANIDLDGEESGNSVPLIIGGIIAAVGLMALGTLAVVLKKRRK